MAYEGYYGRCIGRLMYFLYKINRNAELVTFDGDGKTVILYGKPLCTYEWKDDTDIPIFHFESSVHQEHADSLMPDLIDQSRKLLELKYDGMHGWSKLECESYHQKMKEFKVDLMCAQVKGLERPAEPETNELYERHYAGMDPKFY